MSSSTNQPHEPDVMLHQLTCPSGGVVVLDAGSLLAATQTEVRALQDRLRAAAAQDTDDGRPFRVRRETTRVGDVFVAPMRHHQTPHVVRVVRGASGAAQRIIIELDGSPGSGKVAMLPPQEPDNKGHAPRPTAARPRPVTDVPPPTRTEEPPLGAVS